MPQCFCHPRLGEVRYERRPDPSRLLPEPFILRELRVLHEVVLGEPPMELQLELTDEKSSSVRGPRDVNHRRPV